MFFKWELKWWRVGAMFSIAISLLYLTYLLETLIVVIFYDESVSRDFLQFIGILSVMYLPVFYFPLDWAVRVIIREKRDEDAGMLTAVRMNKDKSMYPNQNIKDVEHRF